MTDFKIKMAELAAKYNISHQRDIDWHNFVYEVEQLSHPELRETEDERIMEEIIQFLRDASNSKTRVISSETLAKWADFLEKQKEQKPAGWSEEDEKNLELVTDCVYEFYPDPVMKYKLKDWLKSLPERFNLQPKNEWSEEDEKIRNAILGFFNPDKGGTKYSSYAELVWWSNWLKNLHGRFNPQPKAEWSEEDEKKINFLSRLIEFQVKDDEYCFGDGRLISKKEAIEMLKSFRPQQKQEWSEEDEEKINNISEIIEHCITIPYSGGTLKLSQEYKKELQCFLKSLRPSWKPSEEQMRAFKGYIEDFQARAEAAVGGWNNFDVMIQLFEQLNKLMQKG